MGSLLLYLKDNGRWIQAGSWHYPPGCEFGGQDPGIIILDPGIILQEDNWYSKGLIPNVPMVFESRICRH